ncbi:DDE-type integrase/transposase/recombinase, partial [Oligella urethralis]|uniref:DDE-type integrase/transposase/recombinase n=1 Tax=Oligella urethralis TaxID=90245 RepID=UPI00288C0754
VPKPMSWVATAPNQVWSWDITYLPSAIRGQFYRLYMTIDIYSRLIIGWEIHLEESAQHAATLISKACLKHGIRKDQLILHSDNGSPMKGATMLATLQKLGIVPSFSRPSVSDDNPYSESLFRALKYTPAYPNKPFTGLEQARQWVHQFVIWYNTQHCHSSIQFVTPEQRHSGQDNAILAHRRVVYETAKEARPERWKNRSVRNWKPVKEVWLNPSKESNELERNVVLAA